MTVDELITNIEAVTEKGIRKYLLRNLNFVGVNEALDYDNFPRKTPLTGSEIVEGEYLLYDCCGHDGTVVLIKYDSLEEMEEHIYSAAGISNPFTTDMIAFVNGVVKPYKTYKNE